MVFLDHDFRISPTDPKYAGEQYNSGIDTAVFLFRNPDHGYDSRHNTKPPPLTEMGGNNAALFHPRPTCVLQGAVRIDCNPVLLGQDRARAVKRDVVYHLPTQQLTFFLASCRVLLEPRHEGHRNMVAQNVARRLAIMRLNRRDDRGVFGLRNLAPPLG
jgi:hypothetical protein